MSIQIKRAYAKLERQLRATDTFRNTEDAKDGGTGVQVIPADV